MPGEAAGLFKKVLDLESAPDIMMREKERAAAERPEARRQGMTITEAGRKYGLSADTLRYYERIGLIPPVPRNKSGIRDYDEVSLGWVELMKCMRSAGVGIEALIEYSRLFQQGEETLEARKALLVEQRRQLLERMEDMRQSLERLDQKIENYGQGLARRERELRGG